MERILNNIKQQIKMSKVSDKHYKVNNVVFLDELKEHMNNLINPSIELSVLNSDITVVDIFKRICCNEFCKTNNRFETVYIECMVDNIDQSFTISRMTFSGKDTIVIN